MPPGSVTRITSAAVRRWSGANIVPKTETVAANDSSATGSDSASPSRKSTSNSLGGSSLTAALEKRRHVVDPGDVAAETCSRDRDVAGAGSDVEDLASRP